MNEGVVDEGLEVRWRETREDVERSRAGRDLGSGGGGWSDVEEKESGREGGG